MTRKTQGPSFTDQDVEDCYLSASQYEESGKRYKNEGNGLTAEAHDKIATRLRNLAGRIQSWLPYPSSPAPTCPIVNGAPQHLFVATQRKCLCGEEEAP